MIGRSLKFLEQSVDYDDFECPELASRSLGRTVTFINLSSQLDEACNRDRPPGSSPIARLRVPYRGPRGALGGIESSRIFTGFLGTLRCFQVFWCVSTHWAPLGDPRDPPKSMITSAFYYVHCIIFPPKSSPGVSLGSPVGGRDGAG